MSKAVAISQASLEVLLYFLLNAFVTSVFQFPLLLRDVCCVAFKAMEKSFTSVRRSNLCPWWCGMRAPSLPELKMHLDHRNRIGVLSGSLWSPELYSVALLWVPFNSSYSVILWNFVVGIHTLHEEKKYISLCVCRFQTCPKHLNAHTFKCLRKNSSSLRLE